MPRPDLWLRKYLADILYLVLAAPSDLLRDACEVYDALWMPLVELIDSCSECEEDE